MTNLFLRRMIVAAVVSVSLIYLLFTFRFFGGDTITDNSSSSLSSLTRQLEGYKTHINTAINDVYEEIQIIPKDTTTCEPYKDILLMLLSRLHQMRDIDMSEYDNNNTSSDNSTTSSDSGGNIDETLGGKKRHLKLFVGVLSTPSKFDNRDAIRNTWPKLFDGKPRRKDFEYKFILGQVDDPNIASRAQEEASKFKDIEFFPIHEDYRSIN